MNSRIAKTFAAAVVIAACAIGASATEYYWDAGGADTNWGTAANWSSDTMPGTADVARFKTQVNDAETIAVTVDGAYTISQFLATPSANNVKYVFTAVGDNGITATSSSDTFIVGKNGSYMSDITFDGGTYTGKYLRISQSAGNGTLTLRNGAKMFNEQVRVGNSAAGCTAKLLVKDGAEYTHVATPYNLFFIVSDKSGTGVVEVDGGTLKALSSDTNFKLSIGGYGNSDASFNLKGGTAEMTAFVVGGVCDQKNNNQYYVRTDRNGSGMVARINVSGGELTVHQNSMIGANTSADAVAELNISGGKVNIEAENLYVGERGNAALKMTGGELNIMDTASYGLSLTHGNGGAATLNLDGGTLSLPRFRLDKLTSGSAVVNFNGTTIKPTRKTEDFIAANSLLTCNIQSGNLVIDTDYDIAIAADLSGTGGIVKRGSGVVTLRGNNTFTGAIVVESGAGAVVSRNDRQGPFIIDGTEGGAFASPLQLHTDTLEAWLEDAEIGSFEVEYGADGAHSYELPRIIGVRYGAGADDVLLYTNLCVGTNVAWSAGGQSGSFTTKSLAPRTIMASDTVEVNNVRDLGGWPLVGGNGRTTNQGVVYRGGRLDAFYGASADEKASNLLTAQLGVKTEIDLRGKTDDFKDIAAKKKIVVANPDAATIEDEAYCYDGDTENTFTTAPWLPDLRYYLCGMDFNGNMLNAQDNAASYAIFTNQIRRTFHLLGTPGNLPAYYHCKIGCDRTGIVSMLLLGLCGVDEETVYRDYLASSFAKCDDSARTMNRVDTFFRYLYRGYTTQGDWRGHSYGPSMAAQCRAYLEMCGVTDAELDNITTAMTGETMAQVLARVDAAEAAEGYRTVSFVAYPGSSATNGVRRLAAGEVPTAPVSNEPTRSGFTFAGWDVAGESNGAVYAIWTAQSSAKTTDISIDFSNAAAKSVDVQEGVLDVAAGADFSGGLRIGAKGAVAIRTTDVDIALAVNDTLLVLKCPAPVFDVDGDTLADSVFLYGHVFGYTLAYDSTAGGIVATVTDVADISSTRYVRSWIGGNDVGSTAATVHIDNATPWNVGNPSTAGSMDVLVFCGDAWMCMYYAKNANRNCPSDAIAIRGGTLSICRTNSEHPGIDRRRVVGNGTLLLDHVGFESNIAWGLYSSANVAVDFSSVHNNSDTWAKNATFNGDVYVTNGQLRCYSGVTFNGNVYFGSSSYANSKIESAANINGTWTIKDTTVDFFNTTPVIGANAKLVLKGTGRLSNCADVGFPTVVLQEDSRMSYADASSMVTTDGTIFVDDTATIVMAPDAVSDSASVVVASNATIVVDASGSEIAAGDSLTLAGVSLDAEVDVGDVAVTVVGLPYVWSASLDGEGRIVVTATDAATGASRWVGGASGNWKDAGNWSLGVPSASLDAVIDTDATIYFDGNKTVASLTVNSDVVFESTNTGSVHPTVYIHEVDGTGKIGLYHVGFEGNGGDRRIGSASGNALTIEFDILSTDSWLKNVSVYAPLTGSGYARLYEGTKLYGDNSGFTGKVRKDDADVRFMTPESGFTNASDIEIYGTLWLWFDEGTIYLGGNVSMRSSGNRGINMPVGAATSENGVTLVLGGGDGTVNLYEESGKNPYQFYTNESNWTPGCSNATVRKIGTGTMTCRIMGAYNFSAEEGTTNFTLDNSSAVVSVAAGAAIGGGVMVGSLDMAEGAFFVPAITYTAAVEAVEDDPETVEDETAAAVPATSTITPLTVTGTAMVGGMIVRIDDTDKLLATSSPYTLISAGALSGTVERIAVDSEGNRVDAGDGNIWLAKKSGNAVVLRAGRENPGFILTVH